MSACSMDIPIPIPIPRAIPVGPVQCCESAPFPSLRKIERSLSSLSSSVQIMAWLMFIQFAIGLVGVAVCVFMAS